MSYPFGHSFPTTGAFAGKQFANIADKSFFAWAGEGQIAGNQFKDWSYDDGFAATAPVGSFPEGAAVLVDAAGKPFSPARKVYDLVGNVGEWCRDAGRTRGYGSSAATDPCDGCMASAANGPHVNRGGTWGDAKRYDPTFEGGEDNHFISTWHRPIDEGRDDRTGFRVACSCDGSGSCKDRKGAFNLNETGASVSIGVVQIPAGTFEMGWAGAPNLYPQPGAVHSVTITTSFWMAQHETTKGSFRKFAQEKAGTFVPGSDDADGCYVKRAGSSEWEPQPLKTWDTGIPRQTDQHPVSCVTWKDAIAFTVWLSEGLQQSGLTCSLPTEAQWEYVARGGQNRLAGGAAGTGTQDAGSSGGGGGGGGAATGVRNPVKLNQGSRSQGPEFRTVIMVAIVAVAVFPVLRDAAASSI